MFLGIMLIFCLTIIYKLSGDAAIRDRFLGTERLKWGEVPKRFWVFLWVGGECLWEEVDVSEFSEFVKTRVLYLVPIG